MGCPQTHTCIKCGKKCTGCSGCVIRDGMCPGCYQDKQKEQEKINADKSSNSPVQ